MEERSRLLLHHPSPSKQRAFHDEDVNNNEFNIESSTPICDSAEFLSPSPAEDDEQLEEEKVGLDLSWRRLWVTSMKKFQRRATFDRIGEWSTLSLGTKSRSFALCFVVLASYLGRSFNDKDDFHHVNVNGTHVFVSGVITDDASLLSLNKGFLALIYCCLIVLLWETSQNFQSAAKVSLLTKVTSSQTMTRIRSTVSNNLASLATSARHRSSQQMIHQASSTVLSAKECFLPLNIVEKMTLADLTDTFRYAIQVNQSRFDRKEFVSTLPPASSLRQYHILDAMDRATFESSGGIQVHQICSCSTLSSTTTTNAAINLSENGVHVDNEDIDALYFLASVRIFAEWRSLRLVPSISNTRYSWGMQLARRDLIQNIQKLEMAVQEWLVQQQQQQQQHAISTLIRPTLRHILEFEIHRPINLSFHAHSLLGSKVTSTNIHPHLPRLKEQSGASGLLWIKRQLEYQTRLFANFAQIPLIFDTTRAAVIAAYQSTYSPYHGFFIRQLFQSSFEAAPNTLSIFQHMNLPVTNSTSLSLPPLSTRAVTPVPEPEGSATTARASPTSVVITETTEYPELLSESDRNMNSPDHLGENNDNDAAWIHVPVDDEAYDEALLFTPLTLEGKLLPTISKSPSIASESLSSSVDNKSYQIRTDRHPLDHVGSFLDTHWTKLQNLMGQCVGVRINSSPRRNVMEAYSSAYMISQANHATHEYKQNHHHHRHHEDNPTLMLLIRNDHNAEVSQIVEHVIPSHLNVMQPLLDRINRMIEKFNMNDPTKI